MCPAGRPGRLGAGVGWRPNDPERCRILGLVSDLVRATALLDALCRGDESASADLLPLVYDELRRVAGSLLAQERRDHTLQPTALVHEAWMRLIDQDCVRAGDEGARRRFVGLAARAMRQVLVEHARRRGSDKRGGDARRVPLEDGALGLPADGSLLLDLETALTQLQEQNPRLASLAELRLFGGLSVREAAAVLEISLATAKSDWATARTCLAKVVGERAAESGA